LVRIIANDGLGRYAVRFGRDTTKALNQNGFSRPEFEQDPPDSESCTLPLGTQFYHMQSLHLIYTMFIVQAYQTSQNVVPRGGIFLGK
jgi:hypothetical protein